MEPRKYWPNYPKQLFSAGGHDYVIQDEPFWRKWPKSVWYFEYRKSVERCWELGNAEPPSSGGPQCCLCLRDHRVNTVYGSTRAKVNGQDEKCFWSFTNMQSFDGIIEHIITFQSLYGGSKICAKNTPGLFCRCYIEVFSGIRNILFYTILVVYSKEGLIALLIQCVINP